MLLTLATVRQELWSYASNKVYSTATAAQKLDVDTKINHAVERILGMGKFRHTVRRCYVPVYNNQITMPRNLEGLLGLRVVSDTSSAVYGASQIYSRFHEFSQEGLPDLCGGVYPTSDLAQTWLDPDPTFYLRCKSTAAEGNITLLRGLNSDWDEYADSVTLAITNGTTTTSRSWNKLPQIQLPASRTVFATLWAVDTVTAEETQIASYAPAERVPSYQRYTVQGSCDSTLALIQGKLAYVPAVAETDIIYPGVFGALKMALMAIQDEDSKNFNLADEEWEKCFAILDSNLQQFQGEAEMPSFRVTPGFGCGDIATVY